MILIVLLKNRLGLHCWNALSECLVCVVRMFLASVMLKIAHLLSASVLSSYVWVLLAFLSQFWPRSRAYFCPITCLRSLCVLTAAFEDPCVTELFIARLQPRLFRRVKSFHWRFGCWTKPQWCLRPSFTRTQTLQNWSVGLLKKKRYTLRMENVMNCSWDSLSDWLKTQAHQKDWS